MCVTRRVGGRVKKGSEWWCTEVSRALAEKENNGINMKWDLQRREIE